jgi:hypothetical protein
MAIGTTPTYRQLFDFLCLASIAISVAEASGGTQGMRAASALTTGGRLGGILWLAARVAQYRCKSEWTHLPCRDECVHSDHRQQLVTQDADG